MTKQQIKKLDTLTQYLCGYQDRIKLIRQTLEINPQYNFLKEVETIESLYESVLEDRKKVKSNFLYASTSGWTVMYFRAKEKYKKNEKFNVKIYFSFVDDDTFE
jgi:hypothetical protein